MHTVHAHCTCILYMHTVYTYCTCILYMHTVHKVCLATWVFSILSNPCKQNSISYTACTTFYTSKGLRQVWYSLGNFVIQCRDPTLLPFWNCIKYIHLSLVVQKESIALHPGLKFKRLFFSSSVMFFLSFFLAGGGGGGGGCLYVGWWRYFKLSKIKMCTMFEHETSNVSHYLQYH